MGDPIAWSTRLVRAAVSLLNGTLGAVSQAPPGLDPPIKLDDGAAAPWVVPAEVMAELQAAVREMPASMVERAVRVRAAVNAWSDLLEQDPHAAILRPPAPPAESSHERARREVCPHCGRALEGRRVTVASSPLVFCSDECLQCCGKSCRHMVDLVGRLQAALRGIAEEHVHRCDVCDVEATLVEDFGAGCGYWCAPCLESFEASRKATPAVQRRPLGEVGRVRHPRTVRVARAALEGR